MYISFINTPIDIVFFYCNVLYNYDILLYTCQRFLYYNNNKICTMCMMPVYWIMILLYLFHSDIFVNFCRTNVICSEALYFDDVASFLLLALNFPGNILTSYSDTVSTAEIMQCQPATVETSFYVPWFKVLCISHTI